MPVVELKEAILQERLGKKFTQNDFEKLCFDFGIELDDVTSEYEKIKLEKGEEAAKISNADKEPLYKIEIPANRYDLLSLEGLTLALKIFEGKSKIPQYKTYKPDKNPVTIVVKQSTKQIRQYIVGAVLRDIKFDQVSFDSFIKLQEKLHFNICRKRTLVAIGTHDFDSLKQPFTYLGESPDNISFKALREEKEMSCKDLFEMYRNRKVDSDKPQVGKYLHIIEDFDKYPIIYDSNKVVCSLPPIINGDHSKLSINSKNIFIEATATDLTKAKMVLNVIVTAFSQYCKNKYSIEQVNVIYEGLGVNFWYPDFSDKEFIQFPTKVSYINSLLGTDLKNNEISLLLDKMSLHNELHKSDNDIIFVKAPPFRSDIMHPVDIVEDVAIGYGYNNLTKRFPKNYTDGNEFSLNTLSDKIRLLVSQCNYIEVLNWALISKEDSFNKMRININKFNNLIVEVSNPKTPNFEMCRLNLLPGVLTTLEANIGNFVQLPIKLFEVGDVVICDKRSFVGARNERRLCAIYCSKDDEFSTIHGLLDRIMQQNDFTFLSQQELEKKYNNKWPKDITKKYYSIQRSNRPSFFPGRQAKILVSNMCCGYFGLIHPKVLVNFGIYKLTNKVIVSGIELNLEIFH